MLFLSAPLTFRVSLIISVSFCLFLIMNFFLIKLRHSTPKLKSAERKVSIAVKEVLFCYNELLILKLRHITPKATFGRLKKNQGYQGICLVVCSRYNTKDEKHPKFNEIAAGWLSRLCRSWLFS